MSNSVYLSYLLGSDTPMYGNRSTVEIIRESDMNAGAPANNSRLNTNVHAGTHMDMPFHFHANGQTVEDFDSDFWYFNHPLTIHLQPDSLLIGDELLLAINDTNASSDTDFLIVKTGLCQYRGDERYWAANIGFETHLADALRTRFPKLRMIGFDSISISSIQHRDVGRAAHKAFLDPLNPIIILEDMDLNPITPERPIQRAHVIPLRLRECDGLPTTVIGFYD